MDAKDTKDTTQPARQSNHGNPKPIQLPNSVNTRPAGNHHMLTEHKSTRLKEITTGPIERTK